MKFILELNVNELPGTGSKASQVISYLRDVADHLELSDVLPVTQKIMAVDCETDADINVVGWIKLRDV
jgi:hypothetical protein